MKAKLLFVVLISLLLSLTQSVKADTIPYQVPGNAQICQNPLAYDTFVFYKPIGFGSTVWYIDGTLVGSGDSIVFTPSAPGNYSIFSTWNSNVVPFMLSIYSAPPAHTSFVVLNGGSANVTNDTLWMCDDTMRVVSNASGSQMTSWHWGNTAGLYSVDAPLYITTPGTYFYYMENPCGITIDTFEVIQLPTSAPVWTDIAFCNQPVNMTLDAGAGWSYLWSTGATTQTIDVSSVGTYMVSLTNHCVSSTSASIDITQETYPVPEIDSIDVQCNGVQYTIALNGSYSYDTYMWNTGETTPTITVATPGGNYSVTVTKGGCAEIVTADVYYYSDPLSPGVCVATFDPDSGINKVVGQSPADITGISEYVLAVLQGGGWVELDTIPSLGVASGSELVFYDHINDPNQQSRTYTVFARHGVCDNLSPLSDWHKTLRVGIFQDVVSQDYVLQIMENYNTLSGFVFTSATVWEDSLNDGNLVAIGTLESGNTTFTIPNPVVGAAYYVSIDLPWNCGGTLIKTAPVAFSNKKVFGTTGIDGYVSSSLNVYPNPSDGVFYLDDLVSKIEVFDYSGRLLMVFENTSTIDLSAFDSGVYNARISNEQGSTNKSLMVVR